MSKFDVFSAVVGIGFFLGFCGFIPSFYFFFLSYASKVSPAILIILLFLAILCSMLLITYAFTSYENKKEVWCVETNDPNVSMQRVYLTKNYKDRKK